MNCKLPILTASHLNCLLCFFGAFVQWANWRSLLIHFLSWYDSYQWRFLFAYFRPPFFCCTFCWFGRSVIWQMRKLVQMTTIGSAHFANAIYEHANHAYEHVAPSVGGHTTGLSRQTNWMCSALARVWKRDCVREPNTFTQQARRLSASLKSSFVRFGRVRTPICRGRCI